MFPWAFENQARPFEIRILYHTTAEIHPAGLAMCGGAWMDDAGHLRKST
jgi:hypothetical protein